MYIVNSPGHVPLLGTVGLGPAVVVSGTVNTSLGLVGAGVDGISLPSQLIGSARQYLVFDCNKW